MKIKLCFRENIMIMYTYQLCLHTHTVDTFPTIPSQTWLTDSPDNLIYGTNNLTVLSSAFASCRTLLPLPMEALIKAHLCKSG